MFRIVKRREGGFTLIEILLAVSVLGLLATGLVITVQPTLADIDTEIGPKNCDVLNTAMSTYRGYLARGYAPVPAWSATNAAGILAELAKPLRRGDSTVIVLPQASRLDLTIGHLTPNNFTSSAVWSIGP